jgi:hypothetical protein
MSDSCFTRYCMAGLEKMYIKSEHVFSASYRLVKGRLVNLRNREQEYKYTMNVLMGLHRARASGSQLFLDIEEDYHRLAFKVAEQSGSAESIAATIWAGACLGTEIPSIAMSRFSNTFLASSQSRHLSAQALAWAIAACLELSGGHTQTALTLARLAVDHYVHERSSLVRHFATGFRSDWASFAASSYMAYAFLMLGRVADSEWARSSGLAIARALVELQGNGGGSTRSRVGGWPTTIQSILFTNIRWHLFFSLRLLIRGTASSGSPCLGVFGGSLGRMSWGKAW